MTDAVLQLLLLIATSLSLVALVVVTALKRRSGCRCEIVSQHTERVASGECSGKFFGTLRVCLVITFTGFLMGFLVTLGTW